MFKPVAMPVPFSFKTGVASFLLFAVFLLQCNAWANMRAGEYAYEVGDFENAFKDYSLAAKVGNPRAQLVLSTMYYHGRGVAQDKVLATVWAALASEYKYENSTEIAKKFMAELDSTQRRKFEQLLVDYIGNYGKEMLDASIYPVTIAENLDKKIKLSKRSRGLAELDVELEEIEIDPFEEDIFDFEDESEDIFGFGGSTSAISKKINWLTTQYFFVTDIEIAADGTTRDIDILLQYGLTGRALKKVRLMKFPPPTFEGEPVSFYTRLLLGQSQRSLRNFSLRDKFPRLARGIRKNKANAKSGKAHDQYIYALTLMFFTGLHREEGEVEELLTSASEQGLEKAMYVLGMKLYQEQTDPAKAAYWFGEAAKQGLANAEFRLAKLQLESPWFERNERKAMFWLIRSANQGYLYALRELGRLQLVADNSDLHDYKSALKHLKRIQLVDKWSPETFYYLALAYRRNGDKKMAISKIEDAIFLGKQLGRDTTEWRETLASWQTRAKVIIEAVD